METSNGPPGRLDGFEICSTISESPRRIPIIIVSARDQVVENIRVLKVGADDYIRKPFTLDELMPGFTPQYGGRRQRLGTIHINFSALHATKEGEPLGLTPREFEVLRVLWINRDRVVTRE